MTPTRNPSPLDAVLRQSLAALMRTEDRTAETLAHLHSILSRIARFYRTITSVSAQCVIEPEAVSIEFDGQTLRCPRLLVQCVTHGSAFAPALTFFYMPVRRDRIVLTVAHGHRVHQEASPILWNASHGWHIPAYGVIDGEAHAKLVRDALLGAGLFSRTTMTLELESA